MRTLIVHNILNDSHTISGVLRLYGIMASEWIRLGNPTDFMVAKAGFPQVRALAPDAGLVQSDGIFNATRYVSKTWLYFPAFAYRMATPHFVRLPARYDVVYASHQFIIEVYAARVVARRQRAAFAVKFQHVLSTQGKRTGFFDRLFLAAERQSVRWIHRHADLLLALSNTTAGDYRKLESALGLSPRPIRAIGCGVDLARFDRTPVREPRYDAVFFVWLHEQKGVFDLPMVWESFLRRNPSGKLLVIGAGPHRAKLEDALADRNLSQSVTFAGRIGEDQKIELLRASRVGISLSYEEGWGLSVTEFLAAGLPVVAYALPVFGEVFPDQLETAPCGDPQTFAERLIELAADPERRRILGERGRRFVERYDFRALAAEELDALREAVARRRAC